MYLDGLEGDVEAGGDLLGGETFLYEVDDLHFPFREGIDVWRIFFFVQQLFGNDVFDLVADLFIPVVDL